jgi:carbon monoxide dehydrogenase subunit G
MLSLRMHGDWRERLMAGVILRLDEASFAVRIQNRFDVPMPPAEAWPFLMDIPATVPCFPGAELVESIDAESYTGRMTVKLGPLTMIFNGKLKIEDRNDDVHSGRFKASWTEAKGRGNADTVTSFVMTEHEGGTRVELDTQVQLAGQVAQYGRSTGMIANISTQLVSKFADNLRARINESAMEHREVSGLTLASRALLDRMKRT